MVTFCRYLSIFVLVILQIISQNMNQLKSVLIMFGCFAALQIPVLLWNADIAVMNLAVSAVLLGGRLIIFKIEKSAKEKCGAKPIQKTNQN